MRCHIKERTGKELGKNRVPSLTIGPQDPALIGAGEKLHNKEFNYLYSNYYYYYYYYYY